MMILGWNCWGLGNLWSVRALRDLVQRWKPKIVFLMETKMKKYQMEKEKFKLGLLNSDPNGPSMTDSIATIDAAALGSPGCTAYDQIGRAHV